MRCRRRDEKGRFVKEPVELKDEPWIAPDGTLWIISPDGKARREG